MYYLLFCCGIENEMQVLFIFFFIFGLNVLEIILKVYKKFFVSDNNNVLFIDLMIGICNKINYKDVDI